MSENEAQQVQMASDRKTIIAYYERASIRSNTDPLGAWSHLQRGRELEAAYWEAYIDVDDPEGNPMMPDTWYLDVLPIIVGRIAAAHAGLR